MSSLSLDTVARRPSPRGLPPGARLQPYAFFLPAFLLVAAVSFLPLGYAVVQSFHRANYLELGRFVGFANFQTFLLSEAGLARARNSLVYVAGSVAVAMPLGVALALALNLPVRFRDTLRTLLVVPWLVSSTVGALLWAWLLNAEFGPIADVLRRFAGIRMPNAVTDLDLAMPAVVLANAWGSYPLVMVFVLAALQTVPAELLEAATIDGAGRWQRFRHVTLPMIRNTILVALVLTTLHAFNGVTTILMMTAGGPIGATDVMAFRVFEEGFKFYRMGVASAGAVIIFALNVAFTVAYVRVLRGEAES